ncbi:hypothetical protein ACIPTP_22040 [Pectobacterium versatile]|uniref:hypothetical protein n=1 Tax=Pectobacterium versatile TaxID=2488639 RepID=UPI00380130EA
MMTPIFTTIQDSDTFHMIIYEGPGQGKSVLLQAEEPTEEQKAQQRMRQEEEVRVEEQRLNAVREAFWHNTPEGHHDLIQLHDALTVLESLEEPTVDQIKAFFMMLPADIIGSALSWGFSDTEVRERTYVFVEENKQAVLAAIKAE